MVTITVSTAMSEFKYDLSIKYLGINILFIHITSHSTPWSYKATIFVIISLSTEFMRQKNWPFWKKSDYDNGWIRPGCF